MSGRPFPLYPPPLTDASFIANSQRSLTLSVSLPLFYWVLSLWFGLFEQFHFRLEILRLGLSLSLSETNVEKSCGLIPPQNTLGKLYYKIKIERPAHTHLACQLTRNEEGKKRGKRKTKRVLCVCVCERTGGQRVGGLFNTNIYICTPANAHIRTLWV